MGAGPGRGRRVPLDPGVRAQPGARSSRAARRPAQRHRRARPCARRGARHASMDRRGADARRRPRRPAAGPDRHDDGVRLLRRPGRRPRLPGRPGCGRCRRRRRSVDRAGRGRRVDPGGRRSAALPPRSEDQRRHPRDGLGAPGRPLGASTRGGALRRAGRACCRGPDGRGRGRPGRSSLAVRPDALQDRGGPDRDAELVARPGRDRCCARPGRCRARSAGVGRGGSPWCRAPGLHRRHLGRWALRAPLRPTPGARRGAVRPGLVPRCQWYVAPVRRPGARRGPGRRRRHARPVARTVPPDGPHLRGPATTPTRVLGQRRSVLRHGRCRRHRPRRLAAARAPGRPRPRAAAR